MFVRTKDGKIFNCYVSEQMGKPIYYPKHSKTNGYIDWNEVYKKSENIIDILEVGDYLNGFKVSEIERYDTNTIIKIGNSTFNVLEGEKIYTPSYNNNNGYEKIEKLKSIVTKEQFESMSYKVSE